MGADFGNLRSEHHRVLREAFVRHSGHEIETSGDGFFVVFERAGDAVAAAVDAQRALSALSEDHTPVRVRIGLHTAEPHVHDAEYVGVGVHRAARICAAGHGGQILLSNATAGVVEDLHLDGVELRELGEYRLKDIERPQRLVQLTVDGLPAEFPPVALDSSGTSAVVTLLLADLVGWSVVQRSLGDESAATAAHAYQSIVIEVVRANDGRELEVQGDTILAAFQRPRDALHAATKIRDAVRIEPWIQADHRCAVSVGIHSGRIADPTGKHLGSVALHVVRLRDAADPWQILVSHATEALLEGEPDDLSLRDLGERALPDIERPAHIFEIIPS